MPAFNVTLRYRLEWTASKIIEAKTEEEAQAKVEKQFDQVGDYATFEAFVKDDSTPELDDECLEVEQVDRV